jgi:hypothetical protein
MKNKLLFCSVASSMLLHPFASAGEPVIFAGFRNCCHASQSPLLGAPKGSQWLDMEQLTHID